MTTPLVSTDRLDLWRPVAGDFADICALVEPEAVRRHLGNRPVRAPDEFARFQRNAGSWALYGYGNCIVRLRDEPTVVGLCGVFHSWRGIGHGLDDAPEAGWIIGEGYWGRGLAREAMTAALDWFDRTHGPRRIGCIIEPENSGSLALADRLGFVRTGMAELDGVPLAVLERNHVNA